MPTINDYAKMIQDEQKKERVIEKEKKIKLGTELIATFSNSKSFFSSKKIERFITFTTFLTLSIIWIILKIKELTTTEFIEIVGLWLAYGGYNSFQIHRDKKFDNQNDVS